MTCKLQQNKRSVLKKEDLQIATSFQTTARNGGVQIPGTRSCRLLNFVRCGPNICGPSVRNLLHVNLLAPTILRWPLYFWKICGPMMENMGLTGRTWRTRNFWILLTTEVSVCVKEEVDCRKRVTSFPDSS